MPRGNGKWEPAASRRDESFLVKPKLKGLVPSNPKVLSA